MGNVTNLCSTRRFVDKVAEADPVPCGGCTACCRGDQAVVIRPEHGDEIEDYGQTNLQIEKYHGEWSVTLKRRPNGDCIFLGMGVCSIWSKRPAVCRAFDCRRIAYTATPAQRDQLVARGLLSREIIEAGEKRIETVQIQPIERPAYERGPDGESPFLRYLLSRG